jgi:hypothetical protein
MKESVAGEEDIIQKGQLNLYHLEGPLKVVLRDWVDTSKEGEQTYTPHRVHITLFTEEDCVKPML